MVDEQLDEVQCRSGRDGSGHVWGKQTRAQRRHSHPGGQEPLHSLAEGRQRVIGRQPLYDRGSLPGFDMVMTIACLKALGKMPSGMQPSVVARAVGRTSSQVFLRKAKGTPSGPGVLDVAPRGCP